MRVSLFLSLTLSLPLWTLRIQPTVRCEHKVPRLWVQVLMLEAFSPAQHNTLIKCPKTEERYRSKEQKKKKKNSTTQLREKWEKKKSFADVTSLTKPSHMMLR